jgi:hypothetical protein
MTCPTCGAQGFDQRGIDGYDPQFHCTILAHGRGVLARCWGIYKGYGHGCCDTKHPGCPTWERWTVERPVGIGKRMVRVLRGSKWDKEA